MYYPLRPSVCLSVCDCVCGVARSWSVPLFPAIYSSGLRLRGRPSHYFRVARVFTGAVRVISIVSCNSSVRWKGGGGGDRGKD